MLTKHVDRRGYSIAQECKELDRHLCRCSTKGFVAACAKTGARRATCLAQAMEKVQNLHVATKSGHCINVVISETEFEEVRGFCEVGSDGAFLKAQDVVGR